MDAVRYERSAAGPEASPASARRTRWAIAAGLSFLVVATIGGVLVASAGPGTVVAGSTRRARLLEAVVLRSVILEQNLGAPAPPGVTGGTWALRGIALRGPVTSPRLAVPARSWVRPDGRIALLGPAQAERIVREQSTEVGEVASGELRTELLGQLRSIVAGERRSASALSSPGGARVVRWFSATLDGSHATVDGYIDTWDERDAVTGRPGSLTETRSIVVGEIEVLANLVRSHAVWRVGTLAQKPYQQAT
ncbi:MAG TPA: hypothetical protein VND23_02140 [Acidimicrobiales bacterium]|nr:hypothetical protein [Acidimicrobiales bacterium]